MIEIIGILAGCLVLLSFTIKEQKKIRLVNLLGCIMFIIYGIFKDSISIIFLNSATLIIHLFYLVRGDRWVTNINYIL